MWQPLALLLLCAVLIYLSCEFFVNGVEWLGQKLNMGATAVGTVLAAFGTALPESVVTLMAVIFGVSSQDRDIGVGAAMGGPLVLATLAYGIVGLCLLQRYGREGLTRQLDADTKHLASDQSMFVGTYTVKVLLGCAAFALKPYCAFFFVAVYALYLVRELRRPEAAAETEALEPLRIAPRQAVPSLTAVVLQVSLSVLVISWAAHLFVAQLVTLGQLWHLSPHVVALVLSPVATELPEILNACIWVRQGKERLALANISGSMMIQATLPSALGIGFTPWLFDGPLWAAAVVTMTAMCMLLIRLSRGRLTAGNLLWCPPLYVAFAIYLVLRH